MTVPCSAQFRYFSKLFKCGSHQCNRQEDSNSTHKNRSSATTEITRDANAVDFKHFRSLKVICCCANRRGIYDFLLALNSNLTSIFNRS